MSSPLRAEAPAHRGAGVTERAARDRVAPRAGTLRGRVLRALVATETGLTAVEATSAIGLPTDRLYTVAPRLPELVHDGYAEVVGRRGDRQTYGPTAKGRTWTEENPR